MWLFEKLNAIKTKNIIYILCCTSLLLVQTVTAQNFEWAKAYGGNRSEGVSLITDAVGNVYVTGNFEGTLDFNPAPTLEYNITSAGGQDTFISKLDNNGNFIWAKSLEGIENISTTAIASNTSGNIFTVGSFRGTVDFNPSLNSTFNLTSAGNADLFISILDTNGNFVNALRIGAVDFEQAQAICFDTLGNVYITGYFKDTVDFNPGSGIDNLTSNGEVDIFILKLSANGGFIWAKSLGGISGDIPFAMKIDAANNIGIVGYFQESIDIDFGSHIKTLTSAGNVDIIILKLDANGDFIWTKSIGGPGFDQGNDISFDTSGNIYTTGFFNERVDFNPNAGVFNLSSVGFSDIYISKLDAAGNFLGAKSIGGSGNDYGKGINIDVNGNIYTIGTFEGTVDFNPDSGVFNLNAMGSHDIYISKLDTTGSFLDANRIGGILSDNGTHIITDSNNYIYTTGSFSDTVDFDPGNSSALLTSVTSKNVFIQKLNSTNTALANDNIFKESLRIYPNPTEQKSTLNLGDFYNNITLHLRTVTGQLIATKKYTNTSTIDFNINGTTGIYFVEVLAENQKTTLKIIKK